MATPTTTAPYFSSRGRKIAIVFGAIAGAYILYRIFKGYQSNKGGFQEVQDAFTELDQLNSNPATGQKITKYQATQMANVIFTAVNGWGTDENAIAKVFSRLSNNADFLAVTKAFGRRKISSGAYNPEPDYTATMTEALHIDLSDSEKSMLNKILIKKKIKYRV